MTYSITNSKRKPHQGNFTYGPVWRQSVLDAASGKRKFKDTRSLANDKLLAQYVKLGLGTIDEAKLLAIDTVIARIAAALLAKDK